MLLVRSLFTNKQERISVTMCVLLNCNVVDCKMIPNSCTTSGFGVNCSTCLPTLLRFVLRIIVEFICTFKNLNKKNITALEIVAIDKLALCNHLITQNENNKLTLMRVLCKWATQICSNNNSKMSLSRNFQI